MTYRLHESIKKGLYKIQKTWIFMISRVSEMFNTCFDIHIIPFCQGFLQELFVSCSSIFETRIFLKKTEPEHR